MQLMRHHGFVTPSTSSRSHPKTGRFSRNWLLMVPLLAVMPLALGNDDDCGNDLTYYLRLAAHDLENDRPAQAAAHLEDAAESGCTSAALKYELGRALQRSSRLPEALDAYREAQVLAPDAESQALAVARYAETLAQIGHREEALNLLRFARELHDQPPPWTEALAISLEQTLETDTFTRERVMRAFSTDLGIMTPADIRPVKSADTSSTVAAPRPSLAFRVHFALDSDEIEPGEESNIRELAEGLSDERMVGKQFLLVGHTDIQGPAWHNQSLSERRADAVRRMLVAIKPELAQRLRSLGRGEQEPLYAADDREVHKWNRRVEVVLDDD